MGSLASNLPIQSSMLRLFAAFGRNRRVTGRAETSAGRRKGISQFVGMKAHPTTVENRDPERHCGRSVPECPGRVNLKENPVPRMYVTRARSPLSDLVNDLAPESSSALPHHLLQ